MALADARTRHPVFTVAIRVLGALLAIIGVVHIGGGGWLTAIGGSH